METVADLPAHIEGAQGAGHAVPPGEVHGCLDRLGDAAAGEGLDAHGLDAPGQHVGLHGPGIVGRDGVEPLCQRDDEPKDVLSSLFSLDAVYVDKNDYLRRDEIFSLLLRVTGEESVLAALNKYGKDLRKTDFINTINELSASFDDERLLDETISAERVYEYSLGPVLSYNIKAYDEVEAFIAIWVEELMR